MLTVYELFRHYHWEWAVYCGILAYGLHRCFWEESRSGRTAFFVPGCFLTAVFTMPLINRLPFTPVFSSQGSSIWAFYLLFFITFLGWLLVCYPGQLQAGIAYTVYYLLFIILVKGALVPLYSAELSMPHGLYALIDVASILGLSAALFLLTILFRRYRLMIRRTDTPDSYHLIILVPFLIIVVFSLFVSGNTFFQLHMQPILSGCLALLLPLLYYNYAAGSKAFAESRELEMALLRTQADLEHYRGMIELDDRIRKERHELKNRYLHIRILLSENRLEELDAYLSKEIGARMESLSKVLTGNTMIDYILQLKQKEAQQHGIPLQLSVLLSRRPCVPDDLFCTILLNLLDNAIEASREEKEPEILVSLSSKGAYLILQVRNRISKDVLISNPGLITTKKDGLHHGHGISIVRSVVREADGMIEIRTDEGYFDVTVALPDLDGCAPKIENTQTAAEESSHA